MNKEKTNTMEQEEVLICECCNYIIDDDDYAELMMTIMQNGMVASSVRIAWKNTRQSAIAVVLESGEMMHIAMKISLSAQIAMKSITPDAAAAMPCFMKMRHTTRTVMHTVEIAMRKKGKTLT